MKSIIKTPLLFCTVMCICFCSCNSLGKNLLGAEISPNDSVKKILGDSVCSVVYQPTQVKLFTLSTESVGDKDETIGGYKVKEYIGCIRKDYYSILLFLLSDHSEYFNGVIYPAAPFIPEVALKFSDPNNNVVDFVFSFSGGQMKVVYNGHTTQTLKYLHERWIMIFFNNLIKNNDWTKILETEEAL